MYLIIAVVLVILYIIFAFNSLVMRRMRVREAFSDIDVQAKRRYDLIPNLVETVKGYAAHEKNVLENVTQARTQAMSAGSFAEKAQAENMLSSTLKSLFAVAENYPQLKANENFVELQKELTDTEDKMQAARRFYNSVVQEYNTAVKIFPKNVLASLFGFKEEPFFEIAEAMQREAVKVKF